MGKKSVKRPRGPLVDLIKKCGHSLRQNWCVSLRPFSWGCANFCEKNSPPEKHTFLGKKKPPPPLETCVRAPPLKKARVLPPPPPNFLGGLIGRTVPDWGPKKFPSLFFSPIKKKGALSPPPFWGGEIFGGGAKFFPQQLFPKGVSPQNYPQKVPEPGSFWGC